MRSYKIFLKKSGLRTPRIELEEIGPHLDFSVRRTHLASEDLFRTACKQEGFHQLFYLIKIISIILLNTSTFSVEARFLCCFESFWYKNIVFEPLVAYITKCIYHNSLVINYRINYQPITKNYPLYLKVY